jgi:hypothetical protein
LLGGDLLCSTCFPCRATHVIMCCCLMWSNPGDHVCCLMWGNLCDHCCCLMWSNPCDHVLLSNVKQPMWPLRVVMIAIGFQYYNLVTNFHPSPNERAPHTTQYWNVKSLKTIKKVNNNISTHLSKGGKLCHQGR